jgi:hypothetical protein
MRDAVGPDSIPCSVINSADRSAAPRPVTHINASSLQ